MKALQLLYRPVQGGMETLAATLHMSFLNNGIEIVTAPMEPHAEISTSMWQRRKTTAALIGRVRPAVVLAHSSIPNFYARLTASTVPVVCVLHSAGDEWADPKLRVAESVLLHRAAAVVAVSERKRDEYVERFPRAAEKVRVIPNGVRGPVPPVPERPQTPHLLFAARVTPQKDLLTLLAACALLRNRAVDFHLWVAGQEPDQEYAGSVRHLIARERLTGRVEMLGNRTDIPELMAKADILAHPSRAEAHSLTLIEAAVQGLPVVITDAVLPTVDPRMITLPFESGSASSLANALEGALVERRKLRALAAVVMDELAREFSIERTTTSYIQLLSDVTPLRSRSK